MSHHPDDCMAIAQEKCQKPIANKYNNSFLDSGNGQLIAKNASYGYSSQIKESIYSYHQYTIKTQQ